MDIRAKVHDVITSLLCRRGDAAPLGDSDSLVLTGRLDSMSVMEIAALLEGSFGVDFARIGFDPVDFDSVESIVAMVGRAARRGS